MKVLLVTTDARVESDVRAGLMGDDVAIVQVATPQRAILVLLDAPGEYDVVVADGDTAPTGGFALARDVKAHQEMGEPMPPVVLLIARDADRWLAKWSRAEAYVCKPVDAFDLEKTVLAVAAGEALPEMPGTFAAPRDEEGYNAVQHASSVLRGNETGAPLASSGP